MRKEQLSVLCDLNKQWFIGEIIRDGGGGMWEIGKPLLFQYKKSTTLNAVVLEFQAYDPITKPQIIFVNICTKYALDANIRKQYLDHVGKIYGTKL